MPIRVEMLGTARVVADGETVHVLKGTIRDQALAHLALVGDWVTRDRLGFLFWADSPDATARHNVRQLLKRIRRLPWMGRFETTATSVRWSVATDVAQLHRAVAEHTWNSLPAGGDLLPGLERNTTIEFEEWLIDERRHIDAVWRSAITSAARHAETRGDPTTGLTLLEPLLATDDGVDALPIYMELATQAGQRGLAISAFERVSARLRDSLGLDPPDEAQRIADRLAAGIEVSAKEPPPSEAVGRATELTEIAGLLAVPECRLVTVTGPGGIGKSTLAQMILDELGSRYLDGGALVSLGPVRDPDDVPSAIAAALSIGLDPRTGSIGQLIDALRDRHMLLVLDNVEHLGSAWKVFARVLEECHGIEMIVTSRERLRLEKEWVYELAGLSPSDGTALFRSMARRVAPHHTVSPSEAQAICEAVGGSPLGIELAAPWLRVMAPEEIVTEIQRDVEVLSGGFHDGAERHRSVAATMEHSWNLASERDRITIEALSVFASPYTRELAEKVAGAPTTVLRDLVDQSLVHHRPDGRYASHPLVRAYAAARLAEDPHRRREVQDLHARVVLGVAHTESSGDRQVALDDVIVAWEHAISVGNIDLIAPAVENLTNVMLGGGRLERGLQLLADSSTLVEASGGRTELALIRHAQSRLLYFQGRHAEAAFAAEQALRSASEADDSRLQVRSILAVGWARKWIEGDAAQYETISRALSPAETLGDPGLMAEVLNGLGCSAPTLEECRRHLERGLSVVDPDDFELRARLLYNLGMVSWGLGHGRAAADNVSAALDLSRSIGDRNKIVETLSSLAFIHGDLGDLVRAQQLADEASDLTDISEFPTSRIYVRIVSGEIRRALGDTEGARVLAHEALTTAWSLDNEPFALRALRLHGQILIDQGDLEGGLRFLACLLANTARKGGDFTSEILDPRAWYEATRGLDPDRVAGAQKWAAERNLEEVITAALELPSRHPGKPSF